MVRELAAPSSGRRARLEPGDVLVEDAALESGQRGRDSDEGEPVGEAGKVGAVLELGTRIDHCRRVLDELDEQWFEGCGRVVGRGRGRGDSHVIVCRLAGHGSVLRGGEAAPTMGVGC